MQTDMETTEFENKNNINLVSNHIAFLDKMKLQYNMCKMIDHFHSSHPLPN